MWALSHRERPAAPVVGRGPNRDEGWHPFEFVWRNDELSNPPGQRPPGFGDEHRMQSRNIEFDPPRRLAITWQGSGDVSFELEPGGNKVLLTVIHRRLPDRATFLKVGRRTGTCTSTCWSPAR
mgnify:CR=1 FL=1